MREKQKEQEINASEQIRTFQSLSEEPSFGGEGSPKVTADQYRGMSAHERQNVRQAQLQQVDMHTHFLYLGIYIYVCVCVWMDVWMDGWICIRDLLGIWP